MSIAPVTSGSEIREQHGLAIEPRRWAYAVWLIVIGGFAVLHALHLSADFPNNTPWISDWAKYTDEGWYGNAAVRAHLFGNWYLRGDFNPAPAVPVWPLLEWVLFSLTGVSIEAARGLAVAFFFANLLLSYWFLRARGPRWMALLAVTFLVTSPFLYCFSRLAILEPMLTAFTLAALNLAVRLAAVSTAGAGERGDRRAFHADDVDQDHGCVSAAGDWMGAARAPVAAAEAGGALRGGGSGRICRDVRRVDGAGDSRRAAARL